MKNKPSRRPAQKPRNVLGISDKAERELLRIADGENRSKTEAARVILEAALLAGLRGVEVGRLSERVRLLARRPRALDRRGLYAVTSGGPA